MKQVAFSVAAMELQQLYHTPQSPAAAPPYGSQYAPTNVLAIVSLILGAGSFVLLPFGPLASLPAVITGYIARSQIARRGERCAQLALSGFVLGYINLGLTAPRLRIWSHRVRAGQPPRLVCRLPAVLVSCPKDRLSNLW